MLVEKPIALTLEDADRIIATAERTGTPLRVGTRNASSAVTCRRKTRFSRGGSGKSLPSAGRACNTRAQGIEILKRSATATPVVDVLTYWVDVAGWFLEGIRPREVTARGHGTVFREAGFDVNDATFALITYENGAVVNLGVYFALPAHAPQLGMGVRIEVYGSEGALILNDDHTDELLITNKGIPHAYIPGSRVSGPRSFHRRRRETGTSAITGGRSPTKRGYGSIICPVIGPARWQPRAKRGGRWRSRLAIEESARTGQAVRLAG